MRKVAELNAKILKKASEITRAIEAEVEDTLEDAEEVVKKYVPARYVKRTLMAIERKLDDEGVEVEFDKEVTREALRRTAAEATSKEELDDLVDKIVQAIVDELEDILKDADDVMDDEVESLGGDDEDVDLVEVEAKLKSVVEHKLAAMGVKARFARNQKKVTKASTKKTRRASLVERIARDFNKK